MTLIDHVEHFKKFRAVGTVAFTVIPAFAKTYQRVWSGALVVGGLLYTVCHFWYDGFIWSVRKGQLA